MKRVLISGITGMDGSHMVDHLLEITDYQIYGMVRRAANPNYSNIKHVFNNPRFKMITGDLSDSQSIDNVVKEVQCDYFINLAAQSFVGSSWQIPEQTFDVDAVGVIRCLEAIRKHVPHCRFYNAGSSEEMGDVLYSPQDINHPARARSPYGAAKIASRQIVKVYRESYNLFAIQGLLYNHESERRGFEFVTQKIAQNVARIYKSNLSRVESLKLGCVSSARDWSYSPDVVDGIWKMLNQVEPKEYILSSGETHTVKEFVELAFRVVGIKGQWTGKGIDEKYICGGLVLVEIDPDLFRPAEVNLLLGDSTPARKELGWQPKTSFKELVSIMVINAVKNSP